LNREDIPKENERVGLADVGGYDDDIYTGPKGKFEGYHTSLAIDEADVSVVCDLNELETSKTRKFRYTSHDYISNICAL
jgi:hypothetical protein